MRTLERIETVISMDDFEGGNLCDAIDLRTDVGVSRCDNRVTLQFTVCYSVKHLNDLLQTIACPYLCGETVKPKICRFCFTDGSSLMCYVEQVSGGFNKCSDQASCTIVGLVC
jgi:hypothetical protein